MIQPVVVTIPPVISNRDPDPSYNTGGRGAGLNSELLEFRVLVEHRRVSACWEQGLSYPLSVVG